MSPVPQLAQVRSAREILRPVVRLTPYEHSERLSSEFNCTVWLKREDLQIVRSYKLRGAFHFMASRFSELSKGVVCASAGNHAQGVAFSCAHLKVKGTIYMPSTTPNQKISQVKMFGKEFVDVVLVGDTFDDSYNAAIEVAKAQDKLFIHPFDDPAVIAGQGTVGLEMLEAAVAQPDYLFVPIGGGGLCAGLITVFKELSPNTKIIGVEPEGAPAMKVALEQGHVVTLDKIDKFVDGAAVKRVGSLNFEIIQPYLHDLVLVPEGMVCSRILRLYNEEAMVVEPAGALAIAAMDLYKEEIKGKTIACIVSGSNNDIGRMAEIKERSLLFEGLKHFFIVNFPQRAGALREFLDDVLGPNDDITHFEYTKKNLKEVGPALVGIELKQKEDYQPLIDRLALKNFTYLEVNRESTLFNYLVL